MTPRPYAPNHEHGIEAIAASWLAKQDDGLTQEETLEFERWCNADPRHAAAIARLNSAWQTLQALRDYHPEAVSHPDRDLLVRSRRHRFSLGKALAGFAAIATVLTCSLVLSHLRSPALPSPNADVPVSYSTGQGGYQHVVLTDNSVLDLNANTQLQVSYTPAERRVELLAGEATFSVAKNPNRPFLVHARNITVRAVGTAFNVRFVPSAVEVLVTEGRIKIEQGPGSTLHSAPPTLTAGEKMLIPSTPLAKILPVIETLPQEQVRERLIWQGPRLRFVETPLCQVVAEFNQHNKQQLELGDRELDQLRVDGSFLAENAEAFVRLMEMNGQIAADRSTPGKIILRKEP